MTATLPEPVVEDLRLEHVFHALAEPLRLLIVLRLLDDAGQHGRPYHWFGFPYPKSTLSHHFKVLRQAGLLRQHRCGTERYNAVRADDVEEKFPGLLALIQRTAPEKQRYTAPSLPSSA
jgi:DNA-binding transcriptional ArsR family regulator